MDFLLTYGLGRMKHFSFVYFSMLLHDSEEGCSHFVFEGFISHGGPAGGKQHLCPDYGVMIVKSLRCEKIENPF